MKCRAWDSNLGPLAYEASVLPTELSFWMKNWEKIMTIYIWFVVQQMYVSLTYPFNIVQHTLSHIVEQRKLDSLATLDNIVWSTVTSCWANSVRQFDPSLRHTCFRNERESLWKSFFKWSHFSLRAGLYDRRFYWSNWVIESDYILQRWATLKLLSNDGSLINKKLIV